MKLEHKISANEINRFVYCPYQWYYKRTYGNAELTKQYKALKADTSNHESHYVKGTKYHASYYKSYKRKQVILCIVMVIVFMLLMRWVITWTL